MLLLIGVACFFDKDEPVAVRCRHVGVQIPQKFRGIAVREVIVCADQKRPGMRDLFRLRKVTVFRGMDVVEQGGELPVISGIRDAGHPSQKGEGKHLIPVSPLHLIQDLLLFPVGHPGHHVRQVGRREQKEMLHPGVMVPGQIVDYFIGAKRMPGENDMFITFLFGEGPVSLDVFIGIGEALIPRPDELFLPGTYIHGADFAEGVICLGVYKVDSPGIQRVAYVVIERIGVKISVDPGDGNHHGICGLFFLLSEQTAV